MQGRPGRSQSHPASSAQVAPQPSPGAVLLSSQVSVPPSAPSPQTIVETHGGAHKAGIETGRIELDELSVGRRHTGAIRTAQTARAVGGSRTSSGGKWNVTPGAQGQSGESQSGEERS